MINSSPQRGLPRGLTIPFWAAALSLLTAVVGTRAAADTTNQPPPPHAVPYLTAAEEAKTFHLPDGYSMELVVGDPIIREPVLAVFDGNGRMFVAEMRSYMQDIDGKNEHTNTGLISVHWSSRRNGVFDRHAVYADHLVLPRMILPLADGILVNETDSDDIWQYVDSKHDGVADLKSRVYTGGHRGGNLEHQPSGLIWDRDNWIYEAGGSIRLRWTGTNLVKENVPGNGGQWGASQDDYGKLWLVNAAGEMGPVNFQEPVLYGAFKVESEPPAAFMETWPLVGLADVQGGPARFRPTDYTLNHLTACCGPDIFRGDRLPAGLYGNLFFGEPVGRLVRRTQIDVRDGITHVTNPYPKSEFLRSTDPNFRPVNMVTAPDGTLYIVDMYRGIIQEAEWVKSDSYLRQPVLRYQLEKNFGRGRIWRLRHRDFKPGPQPRLLSQKPAKLVESLAHPNGWWRDTAQKLLVLERDRSVLPALDHMARSNTNPLARLEALWTMDGLDATEPKLVYDLFKDPDPHVRAAAIRVGESLYRRDYKWVRPGIEALASDPDPGVAIQALLSASRLRWPQVDKFIMSTINSRKSSGVKEIGRQIMDLALGISQDLTTEQRATMEHGAAIYGELCFACHGTKGEGAPLQGGAAGATMAPPLTGSPVVNGVPEEMIDVVLKGLTGPVDGKNYTAQMVPMESNNDEWLAAVISYVRNSFGNSQPFVSPTNVARVRAANKDRRAPWSRQELQATLPQFLTPRREWKVTASDNPNTAGMAIDGKTKTRFDTGRGQTNGMWYQIQLPKPAVIAGLQMDAAESTQDYPRGYEVKLSDDGTNWGAPVASGKGDGPLTEIEFKPTQCKYVRIVQTGSTDGLYWSIHELNILTPRAAAPAAMSNAAPVLPPTIIE